MKEREPGRQSTFVYDEQGMNEVSEQIMNSYNSGFIGESSAPSDVDQEGSEGKIEL